MQATFSIPLDLNIEQQDAEYLCETGVALPFGLVKTIKQVRLSNDQTTLDCFIRPLSYWPDKSIKWLYVGHLTPHMSSQTLRLLVMKDEVEVTEPAKYEGIRFNKQADMFGIEFGKIKQQVALSPFNFVSSLNVDGQPLSIENGQLVVEDSEGKVLSAQVEQVNCEEYLCPNSGNIMALDVVFSGILATSQATNTLQFCITARYFAQSSAIKLSCSLHNTQAAHHPAGKWDLGDPGSVLLGKFALRFSITHHTTICYQSEIGTECHDAKSIHIQQNSSAGKNWQSPVHVDKQNRPSLGLKGYVLQHNAERTEVAKRANPLISVGFAQHTLCAYMDNFWQAFPSALEVNHETLELSFLPTMHAGLLHELQGGEKIGKSATLRFSSNGKTLKRLVSVPMRPEPQWLAKTKCLPWFGPALPESDIMQLVSAGLKGKTNFIEKREIADEFGWRNFGDLWADHEADGSKSDSLFVSHYNNQYDPIYGFLRQYLLTGEAAWFALGHELAEHVKHVDIYHTQADKAEYNGGLFWHTDHYLQAFTATHRSYSKHQESNAYQDHAGGGGPGGQHCYTTGLMLHYFLTGSPSSRQAVMTLADWITHVYEGSGCLLEVLLAFKNRYQAGIKDIFCERYPLDRGTANYMVALMDCYELSAEPTYLQRVNHIIQHTVHPNDDIETRNLANVEATWFYTVFLQGICRFLGIKEALQQFDASFFYARDALLHYANWMLHNEYPYLEKPSILEYPNQTWTAQDMRKVHIFAAAYYYDPEHNQAFLDQATHFQSYVVGQLSTDETREYTRILALLMQNQGPVEYYSTQQCQAPNKAFYQTWPRSAEQQRSQLKGLFVVFCQRLLRLSIRQELTWLKTRLPKRNH